MKVDHPKMFLNDLSNINNKLKKLAESLLKDFGVDIEIYCNLNESVILSYLNDLEVKRMAVIKESAFGSHFSNEEYTKNVLLQEALRLMLTEIHPKRTKKSTQCGVSETMDYKVDSVTGSVVDHLIDEDEARPDLFWRKKQWEEEHDPENRPVKAMDSAPAGQAYTDSTNKIEELEPYAPNVQPVGGTAENEQQAGVYVSVMNPDRFLGDDDVNIMHIEPQVQSDNEISPLSRKVTRIMADTESAVTNMGMEKTAMESTIKELGNLLNNSLLQEGELDRAELVFAIDDVTGRLSKMLDDLSKLGTDYLLPMVDGIRAQFGEEVAQKFSTETEQILQSTADDIQSFKRVVDNYNTQFTQRISDEDADIPLDANVDAGVEMGMDDANSAIEPEMDTDLGADLVDDGALGDLLGAEDGEASEEPLGRAKKESKVVKLLGKEVNLNETQIKVLKSAKKINEARKNGLVLSEKHLMVLKAAKDITDKVRDITETVDNKITSITISGKRFKITENQLKTLLFAKNFKKIIESSGATTVQLSDEQSDMLVSAKNITTYISKQL